MKKTRNTANITFGIGAIYVILFVVFNLLVWMLFKTKTSLFWISYGFIAAAFIAQIISMILSFKTADVETAFFGIPLASFSIYYLCAETAFGLLFMIFQNTAVVLAVSIQLIMLAVFLIIAIISLISRDAVESIGDQVKEKVTGLKMILADIETLEVSCSDSELAAALHKLAEIIKYSDPIANETIRELDQCIAEKVADLKSECRGGMLMEAKQTCRELELLYTERNKKLAISK